MGPVWLYRGCRGCMWVTLDPYGLCARPICRLRGGGGAPNSDLCVHGGFLADSPQRVMSVDLKSIFGVSVRDIKEFQKHGLIMADTNFLYPGTG